MSARRALESLRNIPGVYGSFLVSDSGNVMARDISSIIGDGNLLHAGVVAARLWQGLAVLEAAEVGLEFSAHQLFLMRHEGQTLCVFGSPRVSVATLRAACRELRLWGDAPASP